MSTEQYIMYKGNGNFSPIQIRDAIECDQEARLRMLNKATKELRKIYLPKEVKTPGSHNATKAIVAFVEKKVLGTAEYSAIDKHVYIQGVAVDYQYQGRGVCACLLDAIETFAREERFEKLTLRVIEETGNVAIFEKLGFKVRKRVTSASYETPKGEAVIEVELEKVIS